MLISSARCFQSGYLNQRIDLSVRALLASGVLSAGIPTREITGVNDNRRRNVRSIQFNDTFIRFQCHFDVSF